MPKTPYPYSAQIVAKTLKDWQAVPFEKISELHSWGSTWSHISIKPEPLQTTKTPAYRLVYRDWAGDILCYPEGFDEDIVFEDKLKLGEKLIKPYLAWKEANDKKRRKAEEKKAKQEHSKKLKKFLA
jgi:hypothetical protein